MMLNHCIPLRPGLSFVMPGRVPGIHVLMHVK